MFGIFRAVLFSTKGLLTFFVTTIVLLLGLFILNSQPFVLGIIHGTFPIDYFIKIFPKLLWYSLSDGGVGFLIHYLVIIILISTYVTTLIYIFKLKNRFSLASIGTSVLGFFGITIGITCLSCGALIGLFLVSLFGGLISPVFLFQNTETFLILGEFSLFFSIILSLLFIKKIST